jgi:hypothetical protein
MFRKIFFVLGLTALHGGLCRGISALILKVSANSAFQAEPGAWVTLLVTLSKILYLPIIGLGLYPRHWFPGELIAVPLIFNSLLWGIGIYLLGAVILKLRPSSA